MPAPASIVIPTRERPAYLEATLASIAEQTRRAGAEVVVVDDGGDSAATRQLVARFDARYVPHERPRGLNVARNTGVAATSAELVAFLDDDVRASDGWLDALLAALREHPEAEVFAGRIVASLEGSAPRSCGREAPPVTTLDLGEHDTEARFAWGANMAIRRSALDRIGPFDESLADGGDEQEWQERLRAAFPTAGVLYVAGASVEHRRTGADARLRALARTAYLRGRAARRMDARRGAAPGLSSEVGTLAGSAAHVIRRRCPAGLVTVAHSAGRLLEASRARVGARAGGGTHASPWTSADAGRHRATRTTGDSARSGPGTTPAPASAPDPRTIGADSARSGPGTTSTPALASGATATTGANAIPDQHDDFLSGSSGTIGGVDAMRRAARDLELDAGELLTGRRLRLAAKARRSPPRRSVLVLGVERPERREQMAAIRTELGRSRHAVEIHTCAAGHRGKFENLDVLLGEHPTTAHDWLLAIDDDVGLPRGFLDRFLFLCERFELTLAQPAHRLRSHAAWSVTRRRGASLVRETNFVEIGPVTAFARAAFDVLLPFPELRMGWGLDSHWAAVAREHGWRCGVVDAVAISHRLAPAAQGYPREQAIAEARAFLAERPYLRAGEAEQTLVTHRRL